MSTPNVEGIIRDILTISGTSLHSLCGFRIWNGDAKKGFKNTQPAIVFHIESGTGTVSRSTDRVVAVFKCYGGANTFGSAQAVHRALKNRIESLHEVVPSGEMMGSQIITHNNFGPEPDDGFKSYVAKYSIQVKST